MWTNGNITPYWKHAHGLMSRNYSATVYPLFKVARMQMRKPPGWIMAQEWMYSWNVRQDDTSALNRLQWFSCSGPSSTNLPVFLCKYIFVNDFFRCKAIYRITLFCTVSPQMGGICLITTFCLCRGILEI